MSSDFGVIEQANYERQEKQQLEESQNKKWEMEYELRKQELELKRTEISDIREKLASIESKLITLQDTLARFENQYFFPFKSGKKLDD